MSSHFLGWKESNKEKTRKERKKIKRMKGGKGIKRKKLTTF